MGETARSDQPDIGLSELGIVMPFPSGHPRPLRSLPKIVRRATQAQVGWLNADGPVAGVQNLLLAGRPMMNPIGNTMGICQTLIALQNAVPLHCGSRPIPTLVGGRGITRHEPGESLGLSKTARATCPSPS